MIPGIMLWAYVDVHMMSKMTSRRDWKLKRADFQGHHQHASDFVVKDGNIPFWTAEELRREDEVLNMQIERRGL
jgi:hypothetical protein